MAIHSARRSRAQSAWLLLLLLVGQGLGLACSPARTPTTADAGGAAFEPTPPATYVPQVKGLLTGLPATDAEVQAVTADSGALRGLIDQWMALPEFQAKMLAFYRNAFQQNQVRLPALAVSLGMSDRLALPTAAAARLERSLMDSFPLTVWQLVQEGRPFHETITTRRLMATTAMLAVLSYVDLNAVSDAGRITSRLSAGNLQQLVLDPQGTATVADSIAQFSPATAGPWNWTLPITLPEACVAAATASGDPEFLKVKSSPPNVRTLWGLVAGTMYYSMGGTGTPCDLGSQTFAPLLADADYGDWRMVELDTIPAADATALPSPAFWDVPALRTATRLSLRTPRPGFLGTLAFAANWGTNVSNQARVTANQTLIVALGQSIIPAAAIAPAPVSASDAEHSTDPACAGCHAVLDPLRQFFRQSWSFAYHDQTDAAQAAIPATFQFGGVTQGGAGVGDLAAILAAHPHFAMGWVQKLRFWATSAAADETDPEMQRIAAAFQASGHDFRVLVRELFSSPLVTQARSTATAQRQGVRLSIARRDQFCTALSHRLGLPDVCGQESVAPTSAQRNVASRAVLMPADAYYRAAELPALPRSPDLFYRTSAEAVCLLVADQVVGTTAVPARYAPSAPHEAIADMVAMVMGLPASDPRATPARHILTEHFASAAGAGASARDALRSTFTLACLAPSSVGIGL